MAARKQENQKSALRGWLTDILGVVIVAAVILVFIRPTIISGDSMLPKFFDGDYVIVYKMAYHSKMPKKGDVVVFETEEEVPGAEEGEKLFIKRVIGLPGDVIDIHDGQVYTRWCDGRARWRSEGTQGAGGNDLLFGRQPVEQHGQPLRRSR